MSLGNLSLYTRRVPSRIIHIGQSTQPNVGDRTEMPTEFCEKVLLTFNVLDAIKFSVRRYRRFELKTLLIGC